jgi:hypothetical protein
MEENPYRSPTCSTDAEAERRSRPGLHVTLLLTMVGLWTVTCLLAVVPNNRLQEMGLGSAIAVDLTVGVLLAFVVGVVSIRCRRSAPSLAVFLLTQILAWAHSVGLLALLGLAAHLAIQKGL